MLITNDKDFSQLSKEQVFGVIWLRIEQGDVQGLIKAFKKFLKVKASLENKLIILWVDKLEIQLL